MHTGSLHESRTFCPLFFMILLSVVMLGENRQLLCIWAVVFWSIADLIGRRLFLGGVVRTNSRSRIVLPLNLVHLQSVVPSPRGLNLDAQLLAARKLHVHQVAVWVNVLSGRLLFGFDGLFDGLHFDQGLLPLLFVKYDYPEYIPVFVEDRKEHVGVDGEHYLRDGHQQHRWRIVALLGSLVRDLTSVGSRNEQFLFFKEYAIRLSLLLACRFVVYHYV